MGNRFKSNFEDTIQQDTSWMNYAACINVEDPDIFFPEFKRNTTDTERMKHLEYVQNHFCNICPVRIACEKYSEKFAMGWGIWGEYVYDRTDRRTA